MPNLESAVYPSVEEVMNLARAVVNDSFAAGAGRILTDAAPFSIQYVNSAIRWLQRLLANGGVSSFIKDNFLLLDIPPVGTPGSKRAGEHQLHRIHHWDHRDAERAGAAAGSHQYPRPLGSSVPDSSATTTVKEMAEQKMFRRLTDYFGGRHTLFVVFFALSGFALAWFGKLTSSYVALCSALQTAVLAHSAKEDYFDAKKRAADKQGDDGA